MKTEKIIASVMSAALSITAILPVESLEMNTYSFSLSGDFSTSFVNEDNDYIPGDVNGDSLIEASDASKILAEYSIISTGGKETFTENQKKAADVDNNSRIDSVDASLILSYYSYTSTGGTLDILSYLNQHNHQPPATTTTATVTTDTTSNTATTTVQTNTVTTNPITSTNSTVSTTISEIISTTTTKITTPTVSTTDSGTTETVTTTVSVNPNKVSDIHIDQSEVFIGLGYGALAANVTMFPESALDKSEIWTSSDESIATVDSEGWVIGKKEGDCKITVKSADNPTVSAEITVHIVEPSTVSAIRLNRNEMSIQKGKEEYAAFVTMFPSSASNKEEKWYSSNEEIATVNNEGWLVAKKAGTCAITVQSVDNPSVLAVVLVTVYDNEPPVTTTATTNTSNTTTSNTTNSNTTTSNTTTTSPITTTTINVSEIKLSKYEMTIPVGKEDISIVTMLPYDATNKDETWISSDEKIAAVNKYGWVKGVSVGECIVTVYSVSNPEVKAEIAVKIVDANTDVPEPDINFSYIVSDKSDSKNIAFCTPFPKNASGSFVVDYVITDSNGNVSTLKSSTISAPEIKSVITMLTADTSTFTVEEYITNLATNQRAKIGKYKLCLSPRDTDSVEEDIYSAFSIIDGLSE